MYRGAGNRLAVDFEVLNLPCSVEQAQKLLQDQGVEFQQVEIMKVAREHLGRALYRKGVKMSEAAGTFDCSSFTKWTYAQLGVSIPRFSIDQQEFGEQVIETESAFDFTQTQQGDLVFCSSDKQNFFWNKEEEGIGHVGLVTEEKSIIHATAEKGLHECSVDVFLQNRRFRGMTRYVADFEKLTTLIVPEDDIIETSQEVRWRVIRSMANI